MQLSFLTSLFTFFFDHIFYPSSKSGLENYINRRKPQNIGEVERLEKEYINKINSGETL
jgi:lipopolysaccharide export LptBFGC system permease protein LptF